MNLNYQLKKLLYYGRSVFQSPEQLIKSSYSKATWESFAQTREFDFHKVNKWRNSPEFMVDTACKFHLNYKLQKLH